MSRSPEAPTIRSHTSTSSARSTRQTRRTRRDKTLEPDQAIGVEDALRAYTQGSALALGVAHDAGTITPRKRADLVVLSENPLEADADRIDEIQVLRTYLAGELVYSHG